MWFPTRWVRRQRSVVMARQRIHLKAKLNYLKRINLRQFPRQPEGKTKKRVKFTSQTDFCIYDAKEKAAHALIRRPSRVNSVEGDVIRLEAHRLKLKVAGKKDAVIRRLIAREWSNQLRAKLSPFYNDLNSISDSDLESFYNLHNLMSYLSFCKMAGVDISFLSFTGDKLLQLLEEHHLSPPVQTRLHCIHSLSLYFLDHVSPMEDSFTGIAHRRVTADDFVSYNLLSGKALFLNKDIAKELLNSFNKAKQSCIIQTMEFYSQSIRRDRNPSLVSLFFLLQQNQENIPDVFEM